MLNRLLYGFKSAVGHPVDWKQSSGNARCDRRGHWEAYTGCVSVRAGVCHFSTLTL